MKHLPLILLLLMSLPGMGQITGNLQVRDSSALKLDAAALSKMKGKWKLSETVERRRGEESRQERGILVRFGPQGAVTTSWCGDCFEEAAGQWELLNEQTLSLSGSRTETKYLYGKWVVYALSEQELVLASVLTSSGDWVKELRFTKNFPASLAAGTQRGCLNCWEDGGWCWGERPEQARVQWAMVQDLEQQAVSSQQRAELIRGFDWLLHYAPCVNKSLYMKAIPFYESLLQEEKHAGTKKRYMEKLAQLKAQQVEYFGE
ncbi:hypothetical protein [Cesiribacter andamanensis]|nr:hypothetical protein [Cesiribacter andamanensis]